MKKGLILVLLATVIGWGCAMLGSWKAIPPPGGCDRCHTVSINADWQVAYRPVTLSDETGEQAWQRPDSVLPPEASPMERKKVTEQRCFRCHKGPDKSHVEYKGRYHH